jgi:hypothetical protein
VGDLLDASDDLHRPGAVEVVEDQVEQGGTGGGGGGTLAVAVHPQQVLDPGPGLRRDVRTPVDHPGHRRHRDAGLAGDLRDRDPAPGRRRRIVRCHFATSVASLRTLRRNFQESSGKYGAVGRETETTRGRTALKPEDYGE